MDAKTKNPTFSIGFFAEKERKTRWLRSGLFLALRCFPVSTFSHWSFPVPVVVLLEVGGVTYSASLMQRTERPYFKASYARATTSYVIIPRRKKYPVESEFSCVVEDQK